VVDLSDQRDLYIGMSDDEDPQGWSEKELLEKYMESFRLISEQSVSALKLSIITISIFVGILGVILSETQLESGVNNISAILLLVTLASWISSVVAASTSYRYSGASEYLTYDDEAFVEPRSMFHDNLTKLRGILIASQIFLIISLASFVVSLIPLVMTDNTEATIVTIILTYSIVGSLCVYGYRKFNEYDKELTVEYD
jgi:hypothetical protein